MFESLEDRMCMSVSAATLTMPRLVAQPTVTYIGESPEQSTKGSTQTGTLSDLDKAAIAIAIANALSRL